MIEHLERFVAHTSPWVGVLLLALFVAVGVWAGLRLARRSVARSMGTSRRLGERGRRRAVALLTRRGFRILATEVTREGSVLIDGRARGFQVRADAVVAKRRRRWVAEFKGGPAVGSIAHRGTRRQLLEYAWVFGVRGVLLVDGRRGRIHTVRFPR